MKKWFFLISIVLTTFLLVVLVSPLVTSPATAAGAQKWQFRTENHNTSITEYANDETQPHACDKRMSLTWPISGEYSTANLTTGKRAWWYMDQAAQVSVPFSTDNWTAEVHARVGSGKSETAYLRIKAWKVKPDGTATILAEGESQVPLDENDDQFRMMLSPSQSYVVPPDWTIGCSIEWSGSETCYIDYGQTMGGRDGWCESPPSDPGFPYPELATFILIPAGLAVFIAVFWFRNRRAKATVPK